MATSATIREVLDVNLFGALICSREAVRRMSTTHGGKGGSIVLLSSIAAVTGGATEYVFYAAAKGGVDALTNGLAREVALEGVRVNAIRPGVTDTEIHEPGRVARITPLLPMKRPAQPDEIAEAILFLLVGRGVLRHRRGAQCVRRPLSLSRLVFDTSPPIVPAEFSSKSLLQGEENGCGSTRS